MVGAEHVPRSNGEVLSVLALSSRFDGRDHERNKR